MDWMPPTNARGRVPTMRRNSKEAELVDYDSLERDDFGSGRFYNSCECPCGCIRQARYFPGGLSTRPNLCFVCVDPGEHERPLTKAEQLILTRP